jgi:hypothetical protein
MIQCAAAGGIKSKPISLRSIAAFFCLGAFENEFSSDGLFHDPVRCRGREQIKTYLTAFDHGFFCLGAFGKKVRRMDYFMIQYAAAGGIKSKPISPRSITAFFAWVLLERNFDGWIIS